MDQIKIGWGRRNISMTEPLNIPGQMHMRVSEGIHDPVYATALCVDGGAEQDAVIFLSCDLVNCFGGVIAQLCERVAELCPEIPTDAIIMNVTHTHASIGLDKYPPKTPDGVEIYPGEKVREFFLRQAAEAILEAWNGRKEGGIAYGYGYAVVGHSRRVVYFKEQKLASITERQFMTPAGYAVMYGKTNDPLFSHFEAGADHFLNAMYTFDADEKLTGVVVNVPCPAQLSGQFTKLSADYWHDVREAVAEVFGPDVYVLPQCAAAGDIAPALQYYKKAEARRIRLKYGLDYELGEIKTNNDHYYKRSIGSRKDVAERIVEALREVYGWAKKDIRTQLPVRHQRVIMPLERRKITEEERQWCEENLELLKDLEPKPETMTADEYRFQMSRHNSKVNRNKRGLANYEAVKEQPTIDVPAHIVQIGEIAFATTRTELFIDFMHRLQARSPFLQTFVIQLAGADFGSYLATERAVEAKGYSASMFCNVFSPNAGQQWVENTLLILNDMKTKDEQGGNENVCN